MFALSGMQSGSRRSGQQPPDSEHLPSEQLFMKSGFLFCAPLVLALVAGCVISPRRTVSNGGFPSPSPTISPGGTPSPTPFPTPTVTPTPTPTPTPAGIMSVIVTAVPGEAAIRAMQANPGGSTSPIPGSPFVVAEVPRKLLALDSALLVQGENSLSVFTLKKTGELQQTSVLPAPLLRDAVVNTSDSTVYLLSQNDVSGFRMQNGRMVALPGSPYRLAAGEGGQPEPETLALDSSGRAVYVAFASNEHAPESWGVLNRESDASLDDFSAVASPPAEVEQAVLATPSGSGLRGRLAAVITIQRPQ